MNAMRIPGEAASQGAAIKRSGEASARDAAGGSFHEELERVGLRFTRHAEERLQRRSIALGEKEMARLEEAVRTAESKGACNSLVLMDRLALIVNITTRNVVTACDRDALKDGVFTNIDSTVIVRGS